MERGCKKVGIFSNSIAVILDAVNNLSDALSSLIALIGAKLASKKPDKKHPFGYGRIEYLSAALVAAVVLYAGITSAVESVKKIVKPKNTNYNILSLMLLAVAILVKLVLSIYVKKQGKNVNSTALIAAGTDASYDVILSISVFLSAILYSVSDIKKV